MALEADGDQLHKAADKTAAASQAMGNGAAGVLLRLYPAFSAPTY